LPQELKALVFFFFFKLLPCKKGFFFFFLFKKKFFLSFRGISGSDYELFNRSNFNIRYQSWNYRGCWHQTCPPMVTQAVIWTAIIPIAKPFTVPRRYFSSLPLLIGIGQFARLLPSIEVVAVSQAPSPESNPDSPLPVATTVDL